MSEQENDAVDDFAASKAGVYRRVDEHGRTVAGDASGEWLLDENGDVIDVVFFVSPGWLRTHR